MHISPKIKIDSFLAVITTYNEEKRILQTLNYYHPHIANFLLIDNYSTDSTLSLVRSMSSDIKIVQISNPGTTETTGWWIKASKNFAQDYLLFLSCSEFIPIELLSVYADIAKRKSVDITFSPRTTITSGYCTDSLYCKPSSFFSKYNKLPDVARLVCWRSIKPCCIFPHDSFRSQSHCRIYSTARQYSDLVVLHIRPMPNLSLRNEKVISYAKSYAESPRVPNIFSALADSFSRCILDSLRLVRSIALRNFNLVIFYEYLLRIYLHFLVVFFAFSSLHKSLLAFLRTGLKALP